MDSSFIHNSRSPLVVISENNIEANTAFKELVGYSEGNACRQCLDCLAGYSTGVQECLIQTEHRHVWVSVLGVDIFDGRRLFVFEDITARKYRESKNKATCAEYQAIFNNLSFPVLLIELSNRRVRVYNQKAMEFFGKKPLENLPIDRFFNTQIDLESSSTSGAVLRGSELKYVDLGISRLDTNTVCVTFQDTTSVKCTEFSLNAAMAAYRHAVEGIVITDSNNRIIGVNPSYERITGWVNSELLGKDPKVMASELHSKEFYKSMWDSLTTKGSWEGELWDRRRNGEVYPMHSTLCRVQNSAGQVTHHIGLITDLSEMHKREEALSWISRHDQLTQLPNKAVFKEKVSEALTKTGTALAVVLDLDRFKQVNDTFGHDVGDLLLASLAERLGTCLEPIDYACRQSGDEFLLFIAGAEEECEAKLYSALEVLKTPYQVADHSVKLSFSIGVAAFPADGAEFDLLYRHADGALRFGRDVGGAGVHRFHPEMHRKVAERFHFEQLLQQHCEQDSLVVHYQPKVDLVSGKLKGFEALVRMKNSKGDLIYPDKFIDIAEETGLIISLGSQVLRKACRQIKKWGCKYPVAVNISVAQLNRGSFYTDMLKLVAEEGVQPELVELEITESLMMDRPDVFLELLEKLSGAGFSIAIDDFGTGYSSLAYLKKLPASKLKIDKSFVQSAENSKEDALFIEAIVNLAQVFGMTVVAEGVESVEISRLLLSKGCTEAQGYFFGRPAEAETWLEKIIN